MKERYCFDCGKSLSWNSFCHTNFHLCKAFLKRLWNHNSIELCCCGCFKRHVLNFKHKNFEENINYSEILDKINHEMLKDGIDISDTIRRFHRNPVEKIFGK